MSANGFHLTLRSVFHTCVYTHTCSHTHTHACTHAETRAHKHNTRAYTHIMRVRVHTHAHAHTHTIYLCLYPCSDDGSCSSLITTSSSSTAHKPYGLPVRKSLPMQTSYLQMMKEAKSYSKVRTLTISIHDHK